MTAKLHSVYTIIGEEELLKQEALKELISKCFPDTDHTSSVFNLITLYGESVSSRQVIEEAHQLPFMSNKKMIIVKGAEHILDDLIIDYINNPNKSTCLVLLMQKADKRTSSFISLKNKTKIMEFSHLKQENTTDWIMGYLRDNGKIISRNDAEYISDSLENNLHGIQQELNKLISYTGSIKKVTLEDIENIISENKVHDSFALTDAIQRKDTSRALALINALFNQGKSSPEIIGLLRWMLTRLWHGKELINSQNRSEISRKLRIPLFFAAKFIDQAERFGFNELRKGLSSLLDLEMSMRTYNIPQKLLIENLIINLSNPN